MVAGNETEKYPTGPKNVIRVSDKIGPFLPLLVGNCPKLVIDSCGVAFAVEFFGTLLLQLQHACSYD